MDFMSLLPTYLLIFIVGIFTSGVRSLECYSCVYIHNVESQKSCSDPWSWYRDKFNVFSGPPKRDCPFACMKIVIQHPGEYPTVVRTCGKPCNETVSGTTTTSCCQGELCNGADETHSTLGRLKITLSLLLVYMVITRQLFPRERVW